MKTLIVALFLIVATSAVAATSYPIEPNSKALIQGPSFSGLSSAVLTVYGVTYDMTLFPVFSIYSPSDCKVRMMATSSKAGSVSEPVIGGQWNTLITNPRTPFINISGCTSGVLRRQPK